MSSLTSEQMAVLTCRSGLARSGIVRANCAPVANQLDDDFTGRLQFNRVLPKDGDPLYSTATWTNLR